MTTEIERKFLVKNNSWLEFVESKKAITQYYVLSQGGSLLRVRKYGDDYWLCLKGETNEFSRNEFEYKISEGDYSGIISMNKEAHSISKIRNIVKQDNLTWEIDVFDGDNTGLVIAEIELESEDQEFEKPDWLGDEVSDDYRYFNSELAKNPYSKWAKDIDYDKVLKLKMDDNDADAETLGEYLENLLLGIWTEGEGFSGKRPFGNSGWEYEVHLCLAQNGYIKSKKTYYKDEREELWEYDIEREDCIKGDEIILECIKWLFKEIKV